MSEKVFGIRRLTYYTSFESATISIQGICTNTYSFISAHTFFFHFSGRKQKKKERETMGIRGTTPRQRGGKTLTDEKTQPAEPEIACSSLPQVYAKIFHFWNFQFMV